MKQLAKNKFLVILVGLLLVSNLAMLLFFVILKPDRHSGDSHRPTGKVSEYIKKRLDLTDEQSATFKQYREEHKEGAKRLYDSLKAAKNQFYSNIGQPDIPDSILEASADNIGRWQKEIDLKLYRHFQKLRKACNDNQQAKFDTLVIDMINRPWSKKGDKPDGDKKK